MEVDVLGPFRVLRDGQRLPLGGPRQRAVLAVLAQNVNMSLPKDRLIELVWGGEPPESAQGVLQTYIANLRKVLEPEGSPYQVLVSQASGYELRLPHEAIDAHRFEDRVRAGREALVAGDPGRAEGLLNEALGLWRGPAVGEFGGEPFALGWARRLEELRQGAVEDRIEARLALGRNQELVPELEKLLAEHPLRERLAGQLMLALYSTERQAEASDVYQRTRARLVEETGMEPGANLQNLLKRILNQDPALAWSQTTSANRAGSPRARAARRPPATPATAPVLTRALCPVLVGRDRELTQLEDALLAAARGEGRVVLLSGDAGMGKTRLATELGEQARSLGIAVLSGTCSEAELALPYLPFLEALGNYVARADLDELRARLGPSAGQLGHLFPRLGRGLVELTEPLEAKLRLFEAMLELLELVAGENGLVLVLEDLHRADASTRELLDYIARRLLSARVLVLGTYRADEMHRKHPLLPVLQGWKRSGLAATVQLEALGPEMVGRMVEAIFDDPTRPDTREFLHARCEGNPFVLEELLKEALDRGDIYRTEAGWERKELSQFQLPKTVRDTILLRLERMSEPQVALLRAAAVLGQAFEDRTLLAMLGEEEGAAVQSDLEACIREQLLEPVTGRSYRFRHALTREAVYEDVTATKRERLHRRAAEALESLDGSRVDTAHHLFLAGEPERALPAALKAAEAAEASFAYLEAAELYERSLPAAREPPARARLVGQLGRALVRSGSFAKAELYLREAAEAMEELGEAADAARARVHLAIALGQGNRADLAREERARAVQVLDALGPSEDLALAYSGQASQILFGGGDLKMAAKLAGRAMATAEAAGSTEARLLNAIILGLVQLNLDPDDEEGLALLLRTGTEAARLGLTVVARTALFNYANRMPPERLPDAWAALDTMRSLRGEHAQTALQEASLWWRSGLPAQQKEAAERALALSSDALSKHSSAGTLANALLAKGDLASAKRLLPADSPALEGHQRNLLQMGEMLIAWAEGDMDRALVLARGLLTGYLWPWMPSWLAAIALEAGLLSDVETAFSARLGRCAKSAVPSSLRGQLALARGEFDAAIALLEPVAELEGSVGEALVSSLARLALAEARAGLGDPDGARKELEMLRESAARRGHWLHQEMVRRKAARLGIPLTKPPRHRARRPPMAVPQ